MIKSYLFDWGDTLMVDFKHYQGKMCEWPNVEPITGAELMLAALSKHAPIYIATSANDSSEHEIQAAFERVGLAQYLSGYFCFANLGLAKGSEAFYLTIAERLSLKPEELMMVGDTLEKDITPALAAGLHATWYNPKRKACELDVAQIHTLLALKPAN